MSEQSLVESYQRRTRELLVQRALGNLTMDDEAEIAEELDDIWRLLSGASRQEIERWLESGLARTTES